MAAPQQKHNKTASKSREVRQLAAASAKAAFQKRAKTRKATSKSKIMELTDELNRQFAEVQLQPSASMQLRPPPIRSPDDSVQDLADVLGSI